MPGIVECRLKKGLNPKEHEDLQILIQKWLKNDLDIIAPGLVLSHFHEQQLTDIVDMMRIVAIDEKNEFKVYLYECDENEPFDHIPSPDEGEGDECPSSSFKEIVVPCLNFEDMWENLIFEIDVKDQLMNYAATAILFGSRHVDLMKICCNRIILFHGEPGTGKTTLCKALAQKLAIRFVPKHYIEARFIEINAHSLFSKWFSESGKLVVALFKSLEHIINDETTLTFLLIDEVESLTAARTAALKGNEPSDSIRVVNALLTEIDKLKYKSNVMIFATSNLPDSIVLSLKDDNDPSIRLWNLSGQLSGLSGRVLRKLPLLAYSRHLIVRYEFLVSLLNNLTESIDELSYLSALEKQSRIEIEARIAK
ncbi:ATPase, AAA-type domain-containing protein [Rozella allomycis CSF55]|uniref:ATPase, AAA-type domain-containing protein n=1 Tax=Rozella allomycis (strain CSF55) TaxID=988480 RepID=A0A075AWR5_ROZAC|nr:ATPase, AAA-type domain-containing protein [Rozella allomycis CSF55]|eukprot:EPZ33004.1 ATPase, AAA-type domain-containing protein [Rozella allomycis CSF55]